MIAIDTVWDGSRHVDTQTLSTAREGRYTRRVGTLQLTIEPLSVAGHGEYPRTWVARVDVDVPTYGTTANVARRTIGAYSASRARARAFNTGQRLLVNAMIQGIK